ncbi:UNVERIFIED_CONTAM: hypothetical protein Slati_0389200 [Sesamum latifolium]|uniref:Uncharacterized protein n=1 Tax=Sesamum latifolium TaxID=2727402 RepID=A0AAW2XZW8_9LAMI
MHQEVLVSAFTQELRGGPLFESLAKKSAVDFLDVLARAEKYMNFEDAWLEKKNGCDKRKEREQSARRSTGEPRGCFNPLNPKNDHYAPLITSLTRILMAIDRFPAPQWPKGSEEGHQLPKLKYFCRYHREYEHNTNRCQQLRQEIEMLIQAG